MFGLWRTSSASSSTPPADGQDSRSHDDGDKRDPTEQQRVLHNVQTLMAALPKQSHHRRPLLHYLAHGLNPVRAAQLLSSTASSVLAAQSSSYDASKSDLISQQHAFAHHRKVSTAEESAIERYVLDETPTRSGRKLPRLLGSFKGLFDGYKQHIRSIALNTLGAASVGDEQAFRTFVRRHAASESALAFLELAESAKPESLLPIHRAFVNNSSLFDPNLLALIISFVCEAPAELKPRGRHFFYSVVKRLGVVQVKTYEGEFDCRKCVRWREDSATLGKLEAR